MTSVKLVCDVVCTLVSRRGVHQYAMTFRPVSLSLDPHGIGCKADSLFKKCHTSRFERALKVKVQTIILTRTRKLAYMSRRG